MSFPSSWEDAPEKAAPRGVREPKQAPLLLFLSSIVLGSVGPRHGTGWGPHTITGELHLPPLTGGGGPG